MNGNVIQFPLIAQLPDEELPALSGELMQLIFRSVYKIYGLHRVVGDDEPELEECLSALLKLLYAMQRFNLLFRSNKVAGLLNICQWQINDDEADVGISARLALLLAIQDLYRLDDNALAAVSAGCFQV